MQEPGPFGTCEQLTRLEHMEGMAGYRRGMCQDGGGGTWRATLRSSNLVLK